MAVSPKKQAVPQVILQAQTEDHITDEGRRCQRDLHEGLQEPLMKKHLLVTAKVEKGKVREGKEELRKGGRSVVGGTKSPGVGIGAMVIGGRRSRGKHRFEERNTGDPPPPPPRGFSETDLKSRRGSGIKTPQQQQQQQQPQPQPQPPQSKSQQQQQQQQQFYKGGARPRDPSYQINV
ncbi:hypothetical protein Avbf_02580 [Armadillidium vulgare]|nr:hypothetical protein Avbf_02580 [Armadillidium vulgare]